MAQISYIKYTDVLEARRYDAEYFKPEYLELQKEIDKYGANTILELKCELDCSAFYPSITDDYDFTQKGVPFLRVNEIQNGIVRITENTAFLPENILKEYSSNIKLAYPGDLIIAKGGNSLAKVGLLTDSYNYYSVCRDLIIIRTNKIVAIDKYFLWLFLHSKIGQKIMLRTASQTGQPHLTINEIKNITVPKNTKGENICKNAFLKSIELETQSKQLYREAEQLLLAELGLLDYEVQHSLWFTTTKKEIDEAHRYDSEYFQPKYAEIVERIENYEGGWEFVGEMVKWKKGVEVGTEAYTETGKDFVRVSDFSIYGISEANRKISNKTFEELKKNYQPKQGEILFTKDGTIGLSYVSKEDVLGVLSGAFLRLTLKEKYQDFEKECLSLIFNSILCKMQVEKLSGGALIAHLKPSDFETFKIPLIKPSIQKQIAEKIQESHRLRKESKELLEEAKRKVEEEIERE